MMPVGLGQMDEEKNFDFSTVDGPKHITSTVDVNDEWGIIDYKDGGDDNIYLNKRSAENVIGKEQEGVEASNNLGIPIYSIDSYHGNPAISVPAPFVGGAGPAMHRVSNGVQTNNIGITATQNVGQEALSKYIKRITPWN